MKHHGFTAALAVAAWLTLAAGCAEISPDQMAANAAARERAETRTGSNIPRRQNKTNTVVEGDKDAIAGSARGNTRNPGAAGGPP